ncbi:hypothetical protein F4805DRAFT_412649 [Annulohypoxylon moriforme]|nr:hypothetical protein F4805DRAFT_412649 [Annulohypoxylon moriforme]
MPSFQEFPLEIQLNVAESCTRSTLLSLAIASKALHQLLTPVIYRVVDLSAHNGPDIDQAYWTYNTPDRDKGLSNSMNWIVNDKQRSFIRTLRSRPSLGKHVRTLRWETVECSPDVVENDIFPPLHEYEDGKLSLRKLRMIWEEFEFDDCNSLLWDTFAALTHVQEVDISLTPNDKREACPPPPLFPQAQSLRLSGLASSFLIKSILKSANPESLRRLHLNNLNQFAELEGVPDELTIRKKGRVRPFPGHTGIAGPMRTHLLECSSRWCNLQSLIIDTAGLSGPDPDKADVTVIAAFETDNLRYHEVGVLIRSVAKTLRVFCFQQGPTSDNYQNGWRRPDTVCCAPLLPPRDGIRPMDALFRRYILRAILESSWPQLEKMELFGVASYTTYPSRQSPPINRPLSDETLSQIRIAVGPKPVLDIRADATRLFWMVNSSVGTGVCQVFSDASTVDGEESENDVEDAEDED